MDISLKIALTAAALALPWQAEASFVNNYAEWKTAPAEVQITYLQGAFDVHMQSKEKGEPEWLAAKRRGLVACVRKQKLDGAMLQELVNNHYKEYPADWQFPPAVVLVDAIGQMCLPEMNAERAKLGLPAWPRQPDQRASDTP